MGSRPEPGRKEGSNIMRFPLDNGNGYRCDVCNRIVDSWFVIHVQSLVLKDSTGCNENIAKCDLCKKCYEEKFGDIMKPKRSKKEKKL